MKLLLLALAALGLVALCRRHHAADEWPEPDFGTWDPWLEQAGRRA
jgi:hypothetical protein